MRPVRFQCHSGLGFLQAVDKPRFLRRLLADHAGFLRDRGVDVDALTNNDACARTLFDVFAHAGDALPEGMAQTLDLLDSLADDAGQERILDEANRLGVDLGSIADDLCPGDFAMTILFEQPWLIRVCRSKTVCRKIRRYHEYESRDDRRLGLTVLRDKVGDLEAALSAWFELRKRSRVCNAMVHEDGHYIRLLVTHGDLCRTDGSITGTLERSRISYRPQQHDAILYDQGAGTLKIHAPFPAERNAYRSVLGRVLFRDPHYFAKERSYALDSLRTNSGVLAMAAGIRSARLIAVGIDMNADDCRAICLKGDDLAPTIAARGSLDVPQGEIVHAAFRLDLTDGGPPRTLILRRPNITEHDHEGEERVFDAFLDANGFLMTDGHEFGRDELVAAA